MRRIQTVRFISLLCTLCFSALFRPGSGAELAEPVALSGVGIKVLSSDSIVSLADQLEVKLSPNPEYAEGFVVEIVSGADMEVVHEVLNPKEFMIYRSKAKLYRTERFTGSLFLTNIEKYPYLVHRVICPDGSIHSTSIILK